MRQHAGTANRVWLTILGLLCLAAGVYVLLLASGVVGTPEGPVLSGPPEDVTGADIAPAAVLIAGLVLGVLGLWWMLVQIPRRAEADTFRLQENPARGITVCNPSVLAAAVEDDTDRIPGVVGSTALLRGTAEEPDLTLKVTVNSWADIREVMDQIEGAVVPHLAMALENPLHSLGVQLEASNKQALSGGPVSSSGTVVY
ncbi:alkaline shock response membrane anchor protein AmaP [Arthrobacter gengyunqii]|uniref:Alkaline shock response membrane anchor protein AmaP n=1 Tax=Arthrobacter gengyunqii TaxID=2886940 RepID=A0A9X1M0Q4_9MICC|nr:alkaline shock response membrane anchor protein AmaP [Arthrobacter gengyunqii]MCC3265980.1 alkaline shock response membrane anchor protein AmaP [Arthrobacter gengyunqii]MCC3268695.1 alkaline shock response membrane anchor protein AmaP [Arthrobacter gengyunqii]UOY96080.1 alkaline shock response membrane anchor protein AmaP [Arthrobacter gengyunqii]